MFDHSGESAITPPLARTWRWKPPRKNLRSYDNPFFVADAKAKRLKSLLLDQRAMRGGGGPRNLNSLWVDAVVFVSSPHLKVSPSQRGRTGIYGPDPQSDREQANHLPGLIGYLTALDAARGARVARPLSAAIARAMEQAEIRQSERYRNVASYRLVELLDEGETWQDYRASHKVAAVDKRVRLHLRGRAVDDAERAAIDRAAEREFRLLSKRGHPGIETPEGLEPNPRGLATIYPYDAAAVRLDHWVETHAEAEAEARISKPRFEGVRVGGQLLLALDRPAAVDGGGTVEWSADALVEAAAALAERADGLITDGAVVGPAASVDTLRAIDWPPLPDGAAFDDARLVQLAAAASTGAAVSSRGELYPRNLPAVRAAEAGRLALLGRGGLTVEQVRERIRARFLQAAPLPLGPELDRVLDEANVGLEWNAERGRYVLADSGGVITGSSTSATGGTQYASAAEADADAEDFDRRAERLRADGGFLTATVEPRRLDRAARTHAARLNAPLIDLDAELVAAMRSAAEAAGASWDVLLDADAHSRTEARFQALERLVGRAIESLDRRMRNAGRLVVACDAGLLARYGRLDLVERWRDDLTRVTAVRDEPLAGLVLLVPSSDRENRPAIDGTPVSIVTAGQ